MQRSSRAILFALTFALLSASAATAHAAAWLPGPTLDRYGDVTTDDAGVSTVVWFEPSGLDTRVVARRLDPAGDLGPALDLGLGNSASVGSTAAGGAVAAWSRRDQSGIHVVVRSIAADGALGPVRVAASTLDVVEGDPINSVAPDGATVVVWMTEDPGDASLRLHARHVAADGTLGPLVELGVAEARSVQVATTTDGVTRVLWSREQASGNGDLEVRSARLNAAGALDGGPLTISDDRLIGAAALGSGVGGAVATWFEGADGEPTQALKAVRLPSTDAVAGAPVAVTPSVPALGEWKVTAAVAPDGTATLAWDGGEGEGTPIEARQLTTGNSLGPVRTITQTLGESRDDYPVLRPLRDGSLLVVWEHSFPGEDGKYLSRMLAPDGTPAGEELVVPMSDRVDASYLQVSVGANGDGLVAGELRGREDEAWPFVTARFDGAPPVVVATVSATVVRGVGAPFSATATDPSGIARYDWQFGDGSGANGATATHAYAGTGSYAVTLTATDNSGNSALMTKTVTVVEPEPGPGPGPGPDPGPRPGPAPGSGPYPQPPTARRAPARLKLTTASRSGARVTVAGTLDRRASGRVTLVWTQKSGRRTVRWTATARIARGRFATTLRLPRALARSSAAGRLTVVYGGDADIARGTVSRAISASPRRTARPRP